MLPVMEPQGGAARGWADEETSMSSEPAYEDNWYRVLKRLSDEEVADDPPAGGDVRGPG